MDLNVINDSNVLDDEFKRYLDVAKGLMRKMRLAEDKRVSAKYIKECTKMQTHNATIKLNRNKFFQYLLKAMSRAVEDEKIFINFNDQLLDNSNQEMKQWSADRKSYVAAKVIPGFGALIYMASTDQPDLGWEEKGFGKLSDIYNLPDPKEQVYSHTLRRPLSPTNKVKIGGTTFANDPDFFPGERLVYTPEELGEEPAPQVPTQQVPTQQVPTQQVPTQQVPTQQVPTPQVPTPENAPTPEDAPRTDTPATDPPRPLI